MGRPRREDITVSTTERLLAAGEAHFALQGFDAARLHDIAKDAGITRPSLLYHFDTKAKLYEAVVARTFEQLQTAFQDIATTGGSDFPRMVRGLSDAYFDFLEGHPNVAKIILREFTSASTQGEYIINTKIIPLLDWMTDFITQTENGALKRHLPIRAALLQIALHGLIRVSAIQFQEVLWGEEDYSRRLSWQLLFDKPVPEDLLV